jgi:hypothetical protein
MEKIIDDKLRACKDDVDAKIDSNREQISELHECVQKLTHSVESLHSEHKAMKSSIDELLHIFQAGKGALTVMGWVGKAIRWIVAVGLAIGAVIAYMKGWIPK